MTAPKRIQRQRTKGWRMPEGAVYVGRPTAFGNPFPADIYGADIAVDKFERWATGKMSSDERSTSSIAVESLPVAWHRLRVRLGELRGKDLACWCPLSSECHADVLDGQIDDDAMTKRLATTPGGLNGLLAPAYVLKAKMGQPMTQCIAAQIVSIYNRDQRTKKLAPWWRE